MKLNLHHLILSAAVSAIMVVIIPTWSFAQESEIIPRPYTEQSSGQKSENFEGEPLTDDEASMSKEQPGAYYAKDSIIISSSSKANQQAAHHQQRSKTPVDTSKQPENQKQVDKNKEEKDSILSFNFIYYIFKKFKWSDIVD